MASKGDFTAEEWTRLLSSPVVVGMAVTAADPSGIWGIMKEGLASGWALLQARQDLQANALVKAVSEDFASPEGRSAARTALQSRFTVSDPQGLKNAAVAELQTVASIVDVKAPDDAAAFKNWLERIAYKAAEAGTEGGFLGFGGVTVSEAEKATLAEISSALRGAPRSSKSREKSVKSSSRNDDRCGTREQRFLLLAALSGACLLLSCRRSRFTRTFESCRNFRGWRP